MVLLFMAGISVFMLVYADAFKDKAAMWISLVAMAVMIIDYLYFWLHSYLPGRICCSLSTGDEG